MSSLVEEFDLVLASQIGGCGCAECNSAINALNEEFRAKLAELEKPCVWTYAKDGLCTTPHNGLQLSAGMGPRCIECGRRVEVKE